MDRTGSSGNALEVQAGTFSAVADGAVYLSSLGSLTLGSTAPLTHGSGLKAMASESDQNRFRQPITSPI